MVGPGDCIWGSGGTFSFKFIAGRLTAEWGRIPQVVKSFVYHAFENEGSGRVAKSWVDPVKT